MGKLGTVFGIIAAVLAIIAAALSFLIAQKRVLYADRATKLAGAVSQMVQKIDQNSQSGVAGNITFTAGDKASGAKEDGSLSWGKYAENPGDFEGVLNSAISLAGDLNGQRDSLADALGKTATQLEMLDTDLDPAMLQSMADLEQFAKTVDSVVNQAEAVSARDKAMMGALITASQQLNMSLTDTAFTRRQETTDEDGNVSKGPFACEAALGEFSGKVTGLVTRCDAYADGIAKGIARVNQYRWQADPTKIKDESKYAGFLAALENDLAEINKQLGLYAQAKKDLADQKTKISQLTNEIDQGIAAKEDVDRALKKLQLQYDVLKRATGGIDLGDGTVDVNLTGEVLEVNEEWAFVIVSVGRLNNVPENLKMLVARDDKLVAKLLVSKVLSKVCVAEILPEAYADAVKVGDRVILPKSQE